MNPTEPIKLHLEDPRLTAYVLGELGTDEAANVAQAIAADPALQAEVQEIESIQKFLSSRLQVAGEKLLPAQRGNIQRQARNSSNSSGWRTLTALRDAIQPWIIPASAAAVLALATFIFIKMSSDQHSTITKHQPPNNPTSSPGPQSNPSPIQPVATVSVNSQNLDLPIITSLDSLKSVSKSILTEGKLPPHEAVILPEILNNFTLRLQGVTAISRNASTSWHPDNRDSGASNHAATLSTELIACPWKPSATLLIISVRTNAKVACDLKLNYRPNPATVLRRRLVGFPPTQGSISETISDKMSAGAVANLVIEIEPSLIGGDFGTLEWSTDGTPAPPVTLVHNKEVEPSDDARFVALVSTFSLWLLGDSTGVIDVDVVAALAREIASSNLPPERTEFLNLVDKSLRL